MGELVKVFQKFLMRDLSYITGGGAVILSFLYAFDRLPGENTPTFWYVFGVAFAYVVGYAIQDTFGLCGIIRMKAGHDNPNRLARLLYKLYNRETPKLRLKAAYYRDKLWLYTSTSAPQRFRDDFERTEGLKQVAFTVSPCLFISAIILLTRHCWAIVGFDCAVTGALLVISVLLFLLGWLKVTQQAEYVLHYRRVSRSRTPRRGTKKGSKVRRT